MSKHRLFLEAEDGHRDFGEVIDPNTMSEADLRAAVTRWHKTAQNTSGFYRFVVNTDVGLQLLELHDGFEIREAQTGAVLEQH